MLGNLTAVYFTEKSGNCQGNNLVREKLPKTVHCKVVNCIFVSIQDYRYLVGVCCVSNVKYMVSDHVLLHSYPTTNSNTSTDMI